MSVKLSPIFNDSQQVSGIPASGGLLFTYAAGSTSKQTVYKDSGGITAHANPIVLNARGEADSAIWLTSGLSYKFLFCPSTDSDPPTSPIRTFDNISGVNDTSVTIDQWISSSSIPTYVNATTFTLIGDKTTDFHIGRRVKAQVTAGTVYGTIANSVFTTLTTITVILDSGVLDSGLNSISYGLLTETNNSMPNSTRVPFPDSSFGIKGSVDSTKLVKFEVDGLTTATTRTLTVKDKNYTIAADDDTVHLTGAETIAGIKTFSSMPVFPVQSMVRLNTANGYGSTNTKIRRFTNSVTSQGTDISYADSATLGGSFTIAVSGVYAISFSDSGNSATNIGISLNGTALTTAIESIAASERLISTTSAAANTIISASTTLYLPSGSVIRAHTSGAPVGATDNTQFTIVRVS